MYKGVANNEYEIESILYDETFGSKTMYLVKWKNYPMDQCTWEPYRNLTNCPDILNEYKTNKIFPKDIQKSDKFKKLYDALSSFTELELIELLHTVVDEGIPKIDEQYVLGTIAYLTTVASSNRNERLIKLVKHNLKLIEINKKRQKQQHKLNKWQNDMNEVSGFNISVVNNVDFEGPPKKFIYLDECIAGDGVVIPNDPPIWCHCGATCGEKKRKKLGCHFDDVPLVYNKHKRIKVKVPQGTPIYECNRKCLCDNTCINRVVQLGPSKNLKLQIFRTDNHRGWGVKTLMPIKQGSYVTKYSGEIITRKEAESRANSHGPKSTYMFDLDYNTEKNKCVYSIDATLFGNVSHFINHSCDANLAIYAVWIDCYDSDLPTLALFASRDISVGEEIMFNYMTSVSKQSKKIKCKCSSEKCRGFLC